MDEIPDTTGKNLVEMLDMLRPIPEPEPIPMFPATQGWIWLGLAILALLFWIGHRAWRWWRGNAYRRAALKAVDQASEDPAALAAILRRAALAGFPRRKVAGLTGQDWLTFLNETCPDAGFAGELGEALLRAPWREEPKRPDLAESVRHWVKNHRAEVAS